ncbi:hypothetical protein LOAG_08038, partial [Loa loa]
LSKKKLVSVVIKSHNGRQNILKISHCSFFSSNNRLFFFNFCAPVLVQLQIFISVICLCGLLFTSGCCGKEYFISHFYYDSFGLFLVIFYFFGVFLTFCYCYRMIYLFRVGVSAFDHVGFSSKLFYFSCFLLVFFL